MADKNYKMTVKLSNGTTVDAGTFTAPQGPTGATGAAGAKGDPGNSTLKSVAWSMSGPSLGGINNRAFAFRISNDNITFYTSPWIPIFPSAETYQRKVVVPCTQNLEGNPSTPGTPSTVNMIVTINYNTSVKGTFINAAREGMPSDYFSNGEVLVLTM